MDDMRIPVKVSVDGIQGESFDDFRLSAVYLQHPHPGETEHGLIVLSFDISPISPAYLSSKYRRRPMSDNVALTPAELSVARLVVQGNTNLEVAKELEMQRARWPIIWRRCCAKNV